MSRSKTVAAQPVVLKGLALVYDLALGSKADKNHEHLQRLWEAIERGSWISAINEMYF